MVEQRGIPGVGRLRESKSTMLLKGAFIRAAFQALPRGQALLSAKPGHVHMDLATGVQDADSHRTACY